MKQLIFACATLLCLLAAPAASHAQNEKTLFGASGFSGIWGGWTQGVAVGTVNNQNYSGGFWGLEFGRAFLIGGDHYTISDQQLSGGARYNLRSNGLLLQYQAAAHKAVHPMFGLVTSQGVIELSDGKTSKTLMLQPSVGVQFNVFRIFHASLEGGYRMAVNSNIPTYKDSDFSGAFGQLRLQLGFSWGSSNSHRNDNE